MRVIVGVGGFPGIGSKAVAMDAGRLDFMRDEIGTMHATTMIKDDMKIMPADND